MIKPHERSAAWLPITRSRTRRRRGRRILCGSVTITKYTHWQGSYRKCIERPGNPFQKFQFSLPAAPLSSLASDHRRHDAIATLSFLSSCLWFCFYSWVLCMTKLSLLVDNYSFYFNNTEHTLPHSLLASCWEEKLIQRRATFFCNYYIFVIPLPSCPFPCSQLVLLLLPRLPPTQLIFHS